MAVCASNWGGDNGAAVVLKERLVCVCGRGGVDSDEG